MDLIAITNPSDTSAEANFVRYEASISVEDIIPKYGNRIENGAQIVLVEDGISPRVWQYIAERADNSIWIRDNNTAGMYVDIDDVGNIIATGEVTFDDEAELDTFTVFGSDDDGERFTNVCKAKTAERAVDQTRAAVSKDWPHLVNIDIVLAGDHSGAEVVNVA